MRLLEPELSREMAEMRIWLDRHGYQPSRFDCDQDGGEVVCSVVFMTDAEADAFAARFQADAGLSRREGNSLVPNRAT